MSAAETLVLREGAIPTLSRGCRLSKDRVLLMPEGIIRLSASGLRIVELCDGKLTVAEIVTQLQSEYAPVVHEKIRGDVVSYLALLAEKRAVELK